MARRAVPKLWQTIRRPADPYKCPDCAADFPVESMTEFHMLHRCINGKMLLPNTVETENTP